MFFSPSRMAQMWTELIICRKFIKSSNHVKPHSFEWSEDLIKEVWKRNIEPCFIEFWSFYSNPVQGLWFQDGIDFWSSFGKPVVEICEDV